MNGNTGTFIRERQRNCPSNADAGAGDERGPALQAARHSHERQRAPSPASRLSEASHNAGTPELLLHPLEWNFLSTKPPLVVATTVPVGAAAHDEAEMVRNCGQPRHVLGRMTWMPHLNSVHPRALHFRYPCEGSVSAWVRENRNSTRTVNEFDGRRHRQRLLGNIRRTPCSQIPVKGGAHVWYVAPLHEGACHMRASDCSGIALTQHILSGDIHAELPEPGQYQPRALNSCAPEAQQHRLENVQVRQMQSKDVCLPVCLPRAQLNACDDVQSELQSARPGARNTSNAVVIRERHGGKASGGCGLGHRFGG